MTLETNDKAHWQQLADDVFWYEAPAKILDASTPPFYRWYPDGITNACYNALDVHVKSGRQDQLALIYDSPVADAKSSYTYAQLLDAVATFSGVLSSLGVVKGDRVLIYLPMVPEALIGMLACARLGAIHSVVFGGFASN